jgi:2-oxoglutarate ferredoxin oxidoreductase subunit alpha
MVDTRQKKVDLIANYIPEQQLDSGEAKGKVLVIGWGSTYGSIKALARNCKKKARQSAMLISDISGLFPKTWEILLRTLKQ